MMVQPNINPKDLAKKFSLKIEDLELSFRSKKWLISSDIVYVGDLIQQTDNKLLAIRNFGRTCLREVKRLLRDFDLELGFTIPDWKSLSPQELNEKFREQKNLKHFPLQAPLIKPDKDILVKLIRRVDELDLSLRAANCLKELRIIYIGDLVLRTRSELMKKRKMGRKSVNEIEDKLKKIGLQLGLKLAEWPPHNIEEMLKISAKELEQERRRESEKLFHNAGINCLEDELNLLAKIAGTERNRQIVMKYLGWDGTGTKTMESVAQEFGGMSRQRIRQIYSRFENKFKKAKIANAVYSPFLEQALKVICDHPLCLSEEIELKLVEELITKDVFHIDGIVTAANFLGKKVPFRFVMLRGKKYVVQAKTIKVIKNIIQLAKKAIEHWGVGTISDITAQVQELTNQHCNDDLTISVLSIYFKDFSWLDKSGGWFWLPSVPRNRLINLIQKILSVAERIDISELRAGIGRVGRMEGFAPPRHVLRELCSQISWCAVNVNIITASPPLDWEKILDGTTEWAMASVLKEYGPALSVDEFEEKCLDLGMNKNTFCQFLSYSPIITKLDVCVYGLRGARVPPGLVKTLKPKLRTEPALKDFGWTDNGKIWLAHKISRGMIRTGIFGIPSAMRQFLQGEFKLKTSDGKLIGPLRVKESSAWSLSRLFQRRGGESGDYLVLVFDLALREVEACIGEEDLIDYILQFSPLNKSSPEGDL